MTVVRIVKNWDGSEILKQTPGGSGVCSGIKFIFEPVEKCDYLIILNCPTEDINVECPKNNVWSIKMEPDVGCFDFYKKYYKYCSKVFIQNINFLQKFFNNKYILSHGALGWRVQKSYDELIQFKYYNSDKNKKISCVLSNKAIFPGHKKRLKFIEQLRSKVRFDHFGNGFNVVGDKWNALYKYKYSIAIENSSANYYWTEKISDCFLSWTIPIYSGCKNIFNYFPKEAFFYFDINDEYAVNKIEDFLDSDDYRDRLPHLEEARNLVLKKYNLFNFIAKNIHADTATKGMNFLANKIFIPAHKF